MALTGNNVITPQDVLLGIGTMTTPTAVTSRANITGTTSLSQVTATTTNGAVVREIVVKAKGNTAAAVVGIWIYNGVTSYLFDEITVSAVTASNTVEAFRARRTYDNLELGPTDQIFASTTIQQDYNVLALGGKL